MKGVSVDPNHTAFKSRQSAYGSSQICVYTVITINFRYLQYSLLDEELFSMRNFELYEPLDTQATKENNNKKTAVDFSNKHMVSSDSLSIDDLVNSIPVSVLQISRGNRDNLEIISHISP